MQKNANDFIEDNYKRKWERLEYEKAKKWCVEKLGEKCLDCKIESKNYEIYDFHHPNGHKNELDKVKVLKWYKQQKIDSDVVLLCSNCHRIRTKRELWSSINKKPKPLIFSNDFKWKFG